MKRFLVFILGAMLICSCSTKPDIQDVEDNTRADVESLLTEDNNGRLWLRMDRYFLSDDTQPLTYRGYLKATAFYRFYNRTDSLKVYYDVTIKFRDKKYDWYTISIDPRTNTTHTEI